MHRFCVLWKCEKFIRNHARLRLSGGSFSGIDLKIEDSTLFTVKDIDVSLAIVVYLFPPQGDSEQSGANWGCAVE